MSVLGDLGRLAWRLWNTDGVPSSGAREPLKSDILAFVNEVERVTDIPFAVADAAIVAGVLTLDLETATNFRVDLDANVTSMVIEGLADDPDIGASFSLLVTADGTPRSWAMPGSVDPLDGTYVPSSGNGKRDLLNFVTYDGGDTWLFQIARQDF
jgi:hypothetical protein